MTHDILPVRREGRVAVVTINRPEDGNRANWDTMLRFEQVTAELAADEHVQVVIVTGAGTTDFCLGTFNPDIRAGMAKERVVELVMRGNRGRDAWEALPQITIAAINGTARGSGVELALCCDMRFVADHATIGFPEADMGGFPGGGGPVRLPMVVGHSLALDLMCSGRPMDAAEMVSRGFALWSRPGETFMDQVMAYAAHVAGKGPIALRGAKRIVTARRAPGFTEARLLSDALRAQLEYSHDVDEALAAAREGRAPRYTGR